MDKIIFLAPRKALYKAGDIANDAYLINSGSISIYSKRGVLLGTLNEGDIVGENSFGNNKIRSVSAINNDMEAKLTIIPGKIISAKLNENEFVAKALHQILGRLSRMNDKIDHISSELEKFGSAVDELTQNELLQLQKFLGIRKDLQNLSLDISLLRSASTADNNKQPSIEANSDGFFSDNTEQEFKQNDKVFENSKPVNLSNQDAYTNIATSRLQEVDGHLSLEDQNEENWEERSDETRINSFWLRAIATRTVFGMYYNNPAETILMTFIEYVPHENCLLCEVVGSDNGVSFSSIEEEIYCFPKEQPISVFGRIDDRFIKCKMTLKGHSSKHQKESGAKSVLVVKLELPSVVLVHLGREFRRFSITKGCPPVTVKLLSNKNKIRTKASIVALDGLEIIAKSLPHDQFQEGQKFKAEIECAGHVVQTTACVQNLRKNHADDSWEIQLQYEFGNAAEEAAAGRLTSLVERAKINQAKIDAEAVSDA